METFSIILAKMGRDQDERVIEYVIVTYISTFYSFIYQSVLWDCGVWLYGDYSLLFGLRTFFWLELKLFLYCLYNNLIYDFVGLKNIKIILLVTP